MGKYNKPSVNTKNIGITITSAVFVVIGIICIIIGYGNKLLTWVKTFGIVILVLVLPILIFVIYKILIKKIRDM